MMESLLSGSIVSVVCWKIIFSNTDLNRNTCCFFILGFLQGTEKPNECTCMVNQITLAINV